jgi:hypothetical protein
MADISFTDGWRCARGSAVTRIGAAAIVALAVSTAPAGAQDPAGSATPPTAAQAVEPAVNAGVVLPPAFEPFVRASGLILWPGGKFEAGSSTVPPGGTRVAASAVTYEPKSSVRRAPRPSAVATAAHTVICVAESDLQLGASRVVAHGAVECSDFVELLGVNACIDIWAVGGYWSQLECTPYQTRTNARAVPADGFGRTCTVGRSYRAHSAAYAVHDGQSNGTSAISSTGVCHA